MRVVAVVVVVALLAPACSFKMSYPRPTPPSVDPACTASAVGPILDGLGAGVFTAAAVAAPRLFRVDPAAFGPDEQDAYHDRVLTSAIFSYVTAAAAVFEVIAMSEGIRRIHACHAAEARHRARLDANPSGR